MFNISDMNIDQCLANVHQCWTKMDSEEEIIIADTAVINYFLCVVSIK